MTSTQTKCGKVDRRVKGTWQRPDHGTWTVTFPRLTLSVYSAAEADTAVQLIGQGRSLRLIGEGRGVSGQAVAKHRRSFLRKAAAELARRPTVTTSTRRSALDTIHAAAERYIANFAVIDGLMREPPTPIMRRTVRGGLRPGLILRQLSTGEDDLASEDLQARSKKLLPTRRHEYGTVYHEAYAARRLAAAASWEEVVLLDDEAPADMLARFGLLARWREMAPKRLALL